MKKIFMAISLVVVLTLFFSSCKKKEALDSTTWECETFEFHGQDSEGDEYSSECTITITLLILMKFGVEKLTRKQ